MLVVLDVTRCNNANVLSRTIYKVKLKIKVLRPKYSLDSSRIKLSLKVKFEV